MITKFDISHFRGIRHLTIDGIKQLNVFLGYNNCGKSSVLEALYLFCDPSHPVNNMQINRVRHYYRMDASALPLNFYDLDTSVPIVFEGFFDDQEKRRLTIDYISQELDKTDFSDLSLTNHKYDKVYGLSNTLTIDNTEGKKRFRFVIEPIGDGKARVGVNKQDGEYKDSFNCGFMPPSSNINDYLDSFKDIVENKEIDELVCSLREIEPRLLTLTLVGQQIMADIGLRKLIPIQLLGDGIRKPFSIAIFMYQLRGGVALIDEVDNGLHYKSMPTLWRTIIHMSKKFQVQLFISTHNIDSLRSLDAVLAHEENAFQKQSNIYTLRRNGDGELKALRSDYEQFEYMIKQEMELR